MWLMSEAAFESESARAAHTLREQIVFGDRRPGDRLVERDLAAELGMSRLPVREALKDLVAEGLVTPRPRSWAVVREFTPDDVRDLIEVRSAVEGLAFSLATGRADDDALAGLRAIASAELAAAERADGRAAREAGLAFHAEVDRLGGNRLLLELGASIGSRIRWMLTRHEDLVSIASEHLALAEAMVARDAARVSALLDAHLATSLGEATKTLR